MAPSPPPPPLPKDRLRMMAKHWSEGRLEQWNEKQGRKDLGEIATRKEALRLERLERAKEEETRESFRDDIIVMLAITSQVNFPQSQLLTLTPNGDDDEEGG